MEVRNHQNSLWMYLSNEIELSRTSFPRTLFDASTEEKLLDSLRKAFSQENKDNLVLDSGFSSFWAFANYMVIPTLVPAYGAFALRHNL